MRRECGEKVEAYRYLGVDIPSDGGMGEEANHRITEAKKAWINKRHLEKKEYTSRGKSRKV